MTPFEAAILPQLVSLIILGSCWVSGKLAEATE